MVQFNVKSYCNMCKTTMGQFRRNEEREFPENKLLFETTKQINAKFRFAVEEMKTEAGIDASEVYISRMNDGSISVSMGAELLRLEVVFELSFDIRLVSRRHRSEGKTFSFEREVVKEYNRCIRSLNYVRQELKQAWNARLVPRAELNEAIRYVEIAHQSASSKLSTYNRLDTSRGSRKQAADEVARLNFLLQRLRSFCRNT